MIGEFIDSVAGTAVYFNSAYVATLRPDLGPDLADPSGITQVKLEDGETIRVKGDHRNVADKRTSRP